MTFKVYPTAKIIVEEPEPCLSEDCLKGMESPLAIVEKPLHSFKHGKNGDIGDFTFIHAKKLLIGEGVHIAARITIVGTGSVTIGDYSTIAPGVVIYTSTPDLRFGTNKYAEKFVVKEGDVKIGKNVFIGANAVIPYGSIIPDNTVIGAGIAGTNELREFLNGKPSAVWMFYKRGIRTEQAHMELREMEWEPK